MAEAAGTALGDQERGAAGVTARGRGAPPTGDPTPIGLGRPCGAGRAFADAAPPELEQVVRQARDAAALASRSGPAPVDLPHTDVAVQAWRWSSALWCYGWPRENRTWGYRREEVGKPGSDHAAVVASFQLPS
jgi:hypothetical protein